jgi:hypothetical protein
VINRLARRIERYIIEMEEDRLERLVRRLTAALKVVHYAGLFGAVLFLGSVGVELGVPAWTIVLMGVAVAYLWPPFIPRRFREHHD